ncbi:hypothetical protein GGS20DRAFT_264397 [Poronia punctata]|nr:hypothetical protein GGS20DRAFT_264397 [Poronia punctata]
MDGDRHYTTGQVLCSRTCTIEHIDIPGDRIVEPVKGWPEINGLNNLQTDRAQWLSDKAIGTCIREYHSGLPPEVKQKIDIEPFWVEPKVWRPGAVGEQALGDFLPLRRNRLYDRIKSRAYSIWYFTTGNHWITVIVRKQKRPRRKDGAATWYSHVAQMAVVDPQRDVARVNRIQTRLETILRVQGKFTFADNYIRTLIAPYQRDATSCGPRTYWCAKQMMDRIHTLHENGFHYHERLWANLATWFSEDFVRGEMIGRAAWAGVKAMDYKARLAIECVNRVKQYHGKEPRGEWRDAAMVMKPPPDDDLPAQVPPKQNNQSAQQGQGQPIQQTQGQPVQQPQQTQGQPVQQPQTRPVQQPQTRPVQQGQARPVQQGQAPQVQQGQARSAQQGQAPQAQQGNFQPASQGISQPVPPNNFQPIQQSSNLPAQQHISPPFGVFDNDLLQQFEPLPDLPELPFVSGPSQPEIDNTAYGLEVAFPHEWGIELPPDMGLEGMEFGDINFGGVDDGFVPGAGLPEFAIGNTGNIIWHNDFLPDMGGEDGGDK